VGAVWSHENALPRCSVARVLEQNRTAPDLEHGRFFEQSACGEASEAEQLRVYDVSRPFENQIRENPAGSRRMHHTMAAKAVGDEKTGKLLDRAGTRVWAVRQWRRAF